MSTSSTELTGAGLNPATIETISQDNGEPAWLRERRLEAFGTFESLPLPNLREEEWRRTDIRGLRLDGIRPYRPAGSVGPANANLDEHVRAEIDSSDQTGGLVVLQDSGRVHATLAENLASRGVIFTDLETAAREHSDLVSQYLGAAVAPSYSKFTALNAAFWSGGVFLYVPRRVEVALPLRALTRLASPGLSSLSRTLIVVEPDADVVLVDQWIGEDGDSPAMAANVQEIFVGQGARVRYVALQEWGRNVWNFSVNRTHLSRDATSNNLVVAFGGRFHKANVESALQGPGATSEMLGVLFGDHNQFFDHHTLQDHQAPHTSSDLLYKGALTDHSRSVYSGMIHARKTAQKTDAIQTNRNLLLSRDARADSIPNLEIETNDLRCTHAATVAPIDNEQLFYLQARALTEQDAKRAIVAGFFEPVLERIPLEGVVERLRAVIFAKIGATQTDG